MVIATLRCRRVGDMWREVKGPGGSGTLESGEYATFTCNTTAS
jgi:hypothetical protein